MKIAINGEIVEAGGASLPPGGTTGQALLKASNADRDVEWAAITADSIGAATMAQVNAAIKTAVTGAMEASY